MFTSFTCQSASLQSAFVAHHDLIEPVRLVASLRPGLTRAFKTVFKTAVYKSGTGTRGQGHRDVCVGTWDLGTRDVGLGDIKYGTRGRVGQGRGTSNTGTQGTRSVNDYRKSRR